MEDIQRQAFSTASQFYSCVEGRHAGHGFDIQIHELQLPGSGNGVYRSDTHCFLEYVSTPQHQLQASYAARTDNRAVGQLIFIPPGATLDWHWSRGLQRTVTCMFEPQRMGQLGIYDWDWRDVDLSGTLDLRNDYLILGMRKLGEEAMSPGFAADLQIESILTLMSLELRRLFMPRPEELPPCGSGKLDSGKLDSSQLKRIRDYIYSNLHIDLTLADVADLCGISPRGFSVLFKNRTGVTFRQYIHQARLEKAKVMLTASPRVLIKQVGYECGFRAPAAFVAAFRKATGMTPVEYRQQL